MKITQTQLQVPGYRAPSSMCTRRTTVTIHELSGRYIPQQVISRTKISILVRVLRKVYTDSNLLLGPSLAPRVDPDAWGF
jgi:hypothetical protein